MVDGRERPITDHRSTGRSQIIRTAKNAYGTVCALSLFFFFFFFFFFDAPRDED